MMDTEHSITPQSLIELMPKTDADIRVLNQRAKQLSLNERGDDATAILHTERYIRFKLGEQELYGILYSNIKEVILNVSPTKVPCTPASIDGVINYHGTLLSVLNLKKMFQIESESNNEKSPLIVVSVKGITTAITVDNIEGSDVFDPNHLDAPLSTQEAIQSKYILGLHNGTIAILNMEALLLDGHLNMINKKGVT